MWTVSLAQGTESSDVLIQYGAVGVIAVISLWVARMLLLRETKRADRLEDELRKLNESIHEKYIPVLTEATHAIAEALKALRKD